jgi:mono/diheme cytochrome c family protein
MAPYTPIPPGAAPRGARARQAQETVSPEPTPALLAHGRERYGVFCAPCHGPAGDGDGVVVRRGFPRPPAFTDDGQLALTAARVFDVVTHGKGVMYGFAERVSAQDRWAVTHYVRELQRGARTPGAPPEAAP